MLIAITTLGEGWHNNHHYYQASARNGFFWWELDVTYYVLKALSWVGLVRDLKVPTAEILAANRVKDGNFDIGTFKAHWARAQAAVAHTHANLGAKVADSRTCRRREPSAERRRRSSTPSRPARRPSTSSCSRRWSRPRSWP